MAPRFWGIKKDKMVFFVFGVEVRINYPLTKGKYVFPQWKRPHLKHTWQLEESPTDCCWFFFVYFPSASRNQKGTDDPFSPLFTHTKGMGGDIGCHGVDAQAPLGAEVWGNTSWWYGGLFVCCVKTWSRRFLSLKKIWCWDVIIVSKSGLLHICS